MEEKRINACLDVLGILKYDFVLKRNLADKKVHDAQLIEFALDLLRFLLSKAQQYLGH